MSEQFYRQCTLQKGNTFQTTWIEERFAQKGRPVKLRQERRGGCLRDFSEWDDGWIVVEVGSRASAREVRLLEDQHRRQRRASDI